MSLAWSHLNNTQTPSCMCTPSHWLDQCIMPCGSCVWWVASRGMGQCAARFLFFFFPVYSCTLTSTGSSRSVLLLQRMRESPSNLGIREAVVGRSSPFEPWAWYVFKCCAASVSLIFSQSTTNKEVPWRRTEVASLSGWGNVHLFYLV